MKIQELVHKFEDVILNSIIQIPFCNPEEGVKILLPAPSSTGAGTIFIGTLADWQIAYKRGLLYNDCTYLICSKDEVPETPTLQRNINLLFIDASMRTIMQRLTELFACKEMQNTTDAARLYRNFWNDILSMNISTQQQAMKRIREFPHPLHRHIACIVIRGTQYQGATHIQAITQALQEFFINTNLYFSGEEWIVLYSQEEDTSDRLNISYENLSQLLDKFQLDAGISYVCQLPEELRTLYMTASASIDLGKSLSIAPYIKHIYTYHQYNAYYVIHLCSQRFSELHKTENLIYLTHPDITRLYYYDIANNNNLLEVLFAYLSCGKNLLQASQMLYMHRNTVLNKLKKIEEFLEHGFDYDNDHFLLLLSCMIMHYQHTYTHHNISDYFSSHNFDSQDSSPTDKS